MNGLPWIEMNRSTCGCDMCTADPAVETELTVEDAE